MKKIILIVSACLLSSCAVFSRKCDCSKGDHDSKFAVAGSGVVPPAPSMEEEKTMSAADTETLNKMIKAVDNFIFRQQKDEFTALCKDDRMDCLVNDKRFPAGKKKSRRKTPAFVSGSKTGLQNNERVTVRYSFYL